jgi:hypothetical protein
MPQLTLAQRRLLAAMGAGLRLRDHRDIDGHKRYALHAPEDDAETRVDAADVEALVEAGLISSNKKFPAATYWLTEAGRAAAA